MLVFSPVVLSYFVLPGIAGTVTLPYASVTSVRLTNSSGVTLPTAVDSYFSIPYAQPPTGDRRLRLPEAPSNVGSLENANYGPLCLQAPGSAAQSEDCLTLSVFAPAGTAANASLPVALWIPGGSFNSGGGSGFNMPSMVGHATSLFIGISINYRLGIFGGMSSNLGEEDGNLDLGLWDQHMAIQWAQQYIQLFGGDPAKVTLFGESAGAHSVGYQLLHVEDSGKQLFRGVIMDSGGPTSRAFPNWTYPLYQTQAEELLNMTGCYRGTDANATFACLRSLDADALRNASVAVFQEYNPSIRWPWQPVVEHKFIARPAHESWDQGAFNKVPILTGFNSDEGSIFVPSNLNTSDDFRSFFQTLVPALTSDLLDKIESLYPDPDLPDSPYKDSPVSKQWSRVKDAYGDYAYIAQVQNNAVEATKWEKSVYKYHFAEPTGSPSYLGTTHGSELPYLAIAAKNTALGEIMLNYYTSFIVTGDPNALLTENATKWPAYDSASPQQLLFKGSNATVEADTIRANATAFWRSIPAVLQH